MAAAVPLEEGDFLQTFWQLSSTNEKEREDAARYLLVTLQKKQSDCTEGEVSTELKYTLQRLIKGLASGRKNARHGFFVPLTELLAMFSSEVKVVEVMRLMNSHLQPSKGIKGAEVKDVYFGRFFCFCALIRSGRLSTKEEYLDVARQLVAIAAKKPFMSEMCTVAIGNLMENVHCHGNADDVILEIVREVGVSEGWVECTPERLYLFLRMDKLLVGVNWWVELTNEKWNNETENVIGADRLNSIVPILEASCSSHPRLHSMWQYVLETVRATPLFPEFWEKVVEDIFIPSTHKMKLVTLNLLTYILPTLTSDEVPVVFSNNVVSCILRNASSPSNYLYTPVGTLLSTLLSDRPVDVNIAIWVNLQYRTGGKFDLLSKNLTMKNLLMKLDISGTCLLISRLENIFLSPDILSKHYKSDDPRSEKQTVQIWVADQLSAIVKLKSLPKSNESLLSTSKFLLCHAHYSTHLASHTHTGIRIVPVDPGVSRVCSTRLITVLAELCTLVPQIPKDSNQGCLTKPSSLAGRMKDSGELYLVAILRFAQQLPTQPLEDEALAAWKYIKSVMDELGDGELKLEESAFQLLFAATGLHLLAEPSTASESIEDIKRCYEAMKQQLKSENESQTSSKKKKTNSTDPSTDIESMDNTESESAPHWMEVLIDVLLGLLSQSSLLWRVVVRQMFHGVVHRITPGAISLINNVLRPQTKDELMDTNQQSDEEEEDNVGEEGENEEVGGEEGEGGARKRECDKVTGDEEDEKDDDLKSDDESDLEDDEEIMEEDLQFREDVKKALGSAAAQSEDESDTVSNVSLSDGEMERVDKALSAVFRSRISERSSKKDEEKSIVHFKLRVLDLVQIILQCQHSNPCILDFILPFYHMVRSSRNRSDHTPLINRALTMFRQKLCTTKNKKIVCEGLDVSHTHSILQQLVQCLYKDNSVSSVTLLNCGIMYLINLLVSCKPPTSSSPLFISPVTTRAGRKRKQQNTPQPPPTHNPLTTVGSLDVPMVISWLSDALHNYITKKNSRIPENIFILFIDQHRVLAWQLMGRMIEDLPNAGNSYRKIQGMKLLERILKRSSIFNEKLFGEVVQPMVPAIVSLCMSELEEVSHTARGGVVSTALLVIMRLVVLLKNHHQLNTSLKEEIKAGVGRFNEFRDGEMVMTMLEDEEDKFPRPKKKRPRKRKVSSI